MHESYVTVMPISNRMHTYK